MFAPSQPSLEEVLLWSFLACPRRLALAPSGPSQQAQLLLPSDWRSAADPGQHTSGSHRVLQRIYGSRLFPGFFHRFRMGGGVTQEAKPGAGGVNFSLRKVQHAETFRVKSFIGSKWSSLALQVGSKILLCLA